jgi:hypothetical protein
MFKSIQRLLLAGGIFVIGCAAATPSHAAPVTCITGCTPLTVYDGQDPFPASLGGFLNGSPSLDRITYNREAKTFGSSNGIAAGTYTDDFTLTNLLYSPSDLTALISGTWNYAPDPGQLFPTMVAIKAGNAWFFYSIIAGTLSGNWDTALLDNKNLSDITFYDGAGPIETPLPPAAILFLSALGLAGFRRWMRKNTNLPHAPLA